jgi:hypothetical protein
VARGDIGAATLSHYSKDPEMNQREERELLAEVKLLRARSGDAELAAAVQLAQRDGFDLGAMNGVFNLVQAEVVLEKARQLTQSRAENSRR